MKSYIQKRATPSLSWPIPELCKAYDWPSKLKGNGKIGIVELGGGWVESDMTLFFRALGQPVPSIQDISVDGTENTKQSPPNDADYEVALDIQNAGAAFYLATGRPAEILVFWAQDIASAVLAAAKAGCAVCSISWGADEAEWGKEGCEQMEAVALAATEAGMVVFAAAGDNDSSDGGATPANVDCPASCPHVIACGGTTKLRHTEVVWNNNDGKADGSGTGGGYSSIFPVQSSQKGAPAAPPRLPGDKNPGTGRMVPDVAAVADPDTGYEIAIYGAWTVIGGTSAVAPLYAGLFAAFGEKLGFVSPKLWENQPAFTDITVGNNGDYRAEKGPDPCTGIGVLIASRVAALFETSAA